MRSDALLVQECSEWTAKSSPGDGALTISLNCKSVMLLFMMVGLSVYACMITVPSSWGWIGTA
jgi:hypothetical protein